MYVAVVQSGNPLIFVQLREGGFICKHKLTKHSGYPTDHESLLQSILV